MPLWFALASAAAEPAPFEWTLRVDGAAVAATPGPLKGGPKGWSCSLAIEAPRVAKGTTEQAGVIGCEGPGGVYAETLVLCLTHPDRPTDRGSGSLVLTQGDKEVAIELACRSPGVTERPFLQLEPGRAPAGRAGLPTDRRPPTPGTYRWQLPGAPTAKGWTCTDAVSGVVDATWGYAEYATLSCEAAGTRLTTLVPCVRAVAEAHVCQAGNLRIAAADGPIEGRLAVCEDVGNPGCF